MTKDNTRKKSVAKAVAHAVPDWPFNKGSSFHPELIPWVVISGVILALVLNTCMGNWVFDTSRIWLTVLTSIIGISIGGLFGYVQGYMCHIFLWQMQHWAKTRGWSFKHRKPKLHKYLNSADDLKHSSIYWHRARKSEFMTRRVHERGACIHRASLRRGEDHQGVFLFFDTGVECPDMVIHPHHMADRLSIPGTMKRVNFESSDFNNKWTVRAKNPKEAYDRLSQKTLSYIMQGNTDHSIEFKGGLVILLNIKNDGGLEPEVKLIQYAARFAEVVPDDLLAPYDFGPILHERSPNLFNEPYHH